MNEYKNKLSKTDLRDYYLCPVNLWRLKNQGFEKKPFTLKQKFYFEQGQKIELEARKFIDTISPPKPQTDLSNVKEYRSA